MWWQNLSKQQKLLTAGVVSVLLIMAFIVLFLMRQKYEPKDERISEPTPEELIESTTAPGGSLLTPEEEQELIEAATAPRDSLLTPQEEQELIDATTAPGN